MSVVVSGGSGSCVYCVNDIGYRYMDCVGMNMCGYNGDCRRCLDDMLLPFGECDRRGYCSSVDTRQDRQDRGKLVRQDRQDRQYGGLCEECVSGMRLNYMQCVY